MADLSNIKALAFDVGGTVIDWHEGVSRQLAEYGASRGIDHDWVALTKAWRTAALTMALNSRTADLPEGNIDGVHRKTLDSLLDESGLDIAAADRDEMVRYWHRVDCWPDAAPGHARLHKKFLMATLTILSVRLIAEVSRRAPFQWDATMTCEMMDEYKLNPSVYRLGARYLQLRPDEVLMVAAHNFDLLAAQKEGLRTAFIRRPLEWGAETKEPDPDPSIDIVADDLEDLATKLGC